jgi:phosphatidylglycerol:prolipoprotein diacylglycerol transferase
MARYRKLPVLKLADSVAAALALGSAIGRIGCFLEGCCYGVAAEPPFGIEFAGRGLTGTYLPTQLVEMTWGFITFAALYFWIPKKLKLKKDGSLFVIYLGFYGLGRFLIEFVRTAPWRLFGVFTFSQLVSAALLIFAIGYIVARRRAGKL